MLDPIFETFRKAVATGRPGTPVAARVALECLPDKQGLDQPLALAANMLEQVFGSPHCQISVFGSAAGHQLSCLIRFSKGESALITVAATPEPRPAECIVFADRGTLRWIADDLAMQTKIALSECSDGDTNTWSNGAARLLSQIRQQMLQTTEPVAEPRSRTLPLQPAACPPPYGVLLVSGDHTHQPGYASALASDPRCHLIAVTDQPDISERRREKNKQLAERLTIPYLADLASALAREDVQIVSVCAEPYRRGQIIVQAAQAGKHLYLDKPLCATDDEVDAIVAAVRESGVVAHMFSQVCFAPARRARDYVNANVAGELAAIHTDLCFAKGQAGTASLGKPRAESEHPVRFERLDSKRELTNVGVYNVVFLLWLTQRDVKRVVASTGNYFFAEHQANDMEDFGQILLEFEGGLIATITAGRLGWQSHPSSGLNRTWLVGSRRTAVIDAHQPRVEMWTAAENWQPPARDPEDPMGMWQSPPGHPFQTAPKLDWTVPGSASWQLDSSHFLDCIEQGRPSEVGAEMAADATRVLLAAYRSAATGKVIELS